MAGFRSDFNAFLIRRFLNELKNIPDMDKLLILFGNSCSFIWYMAYPSSKLCMSVTYVINDKLCCIFFFRIAQCIFDLSKQISFGKLKLNKNLFNHECFVNSLIDSINNSSFLSIHVLESMFILSDSSLLIFCFFIIIFSLILVFMRIIYSRQQFRVFIV